MLAKVTPELQMRRFPSIYWGKNGYARELPKKGPVGVFSGVFESHSSEFAVGPFVLPEKRKVALLCARDSSFSLSKNYSGEGIKTLRNCNIQNYERAAKFLLSQNYLVIRMGSKTVGKISVTNPRFFDYSTCDYKSEELDIKLFQSAEIVISSNYGLDHLAFLFGHPVLYTNQYYLLNLEFLAYMPNLRFIMKHPIDATSHHILTLKELSRRAPLGIWDDNIISDARLVLLENNPHEILDATQELQQIKENRNFRDEYCNLTPRQIRFWQNYQEATGISIDFSRLSSAPSEVFLIQNSSWLA
jgi:putative glycosyltransferase (TIGR04372 family)